MIDEVTAIVDTDGSTMIVVSGNYDTPELFEVRTNIPDSELMCEILENAAHAVRSSTKGGFSVFPDEPFHRDA